jgi:hypothetical protein
MSERNSVLKIKKISWKNFIYTMKFGHNSIDRDKMLRNRFAIASVKNIFFSRASERVYALSAHTPGFLIFFQH